MARKLAHEDDTESSCSDSTPGGNVLLNRRRYVQLGAAAVVSTLGVGSAVSASTSGDGQTFTTDFSEYTQ